MAAENDRDGLSTNLPSGSPGMGNLGGRGGTRRRPRRLRREPHSCNNLVTNIKEYPGDGAGDTAGSTMVDFAGAQQLWAEVLASLRVKLPANIFDTWLVNTEGLSVDPQRFLVLVSTPFAIVWLERRLYRDIQGELKRLTGKTLDLGFTVHRTDDQGDVILYSPAVNLDLCHSNPCLRDHFSEAHQQNIADYLKETWGVWDPEHLIDVWSFPVIEATVRHLADIKAPFSRWGSPSGFFITWIDRIAQECGLTEKEIERRKDEARKPYLRRPSR